MLGSGFCQDKIISTGGEGGMVNTSNAELWDRMWSLKDHGKSHDAVFVREHPIGFRWLHDALVLTFVSLSFRALLAVSSYSVRHGLLFVPAMHSYYRRHFKIFLLFEFHSPKVMLPMPGTSFMLSWS